MLGVTWHNEQLFADGYEPKDFLETGKLQQFFAQVIDINPHNIKIRDTLPAHLTETAQPKQLTDADIVDN